MHGELWWVQNRLPLVRGEKVRVTARHGLILEVEPTPSTSKENNHV